MARQETTDNMESKGKGQSRRGMTAGGNGAALERGTQALEPAARKTVRVGRVGARGLGWLSIGLGAAELCAPRGVARLIGVRGTDTACHVLRALGAREVASGLGILLGGRPRPWLWARVAGDALDLALLGAAMDTRRANHERLTAAGAAVAGVALVDMMAASLVGGHTGTAARGIDLTCSVTINKPPKEVYRFWRSLEKLPEFMAHVESVRTFDDRRSRWTARGPLGKKLEWDAEIVEDRPGECIAWRSLSGSDVVNAGEVRFVPAPGGRGTEVHVAMSYRAPAGAVGAAVAKLFGRDPRKQIAADLRRLKQVIETGEVIQSDASIVRGAPAPARPPTERPEIPATGNGGV